MNFPCKNCQTRFPGCHAGCAAYLEAAKARREACTPDFFRHELDDYQTRTNFRLQKRKGIRRI